MASHASVVKEQLLLHRRSFHRQCEGDHEIWSSPVTGGHVPVDGKILSRHTANAIMKQAGIPHRF